MKSSCYLLDSTQALTVHFSQVLSQITMGATWAGRAHSTQGQPILGQAWAEKSQSDVRLGYLGSATQGQQERALFMYFFIYIHMIIIDE